MPFQFLRLHYLKTLNSKIGICKILEMHDFLFKGWKANAFFDPNPQDSSLLLHQLYTKLSIVHRKKIKF